MRRCCHGGSGGEDGGSHAGPAEGGKAQQNSTNSARQPLVSHVAGAEELLRSPLGKRPAAIERRGA